MLERLFDSVRIAVFWRPLDSVVPGSWQPRPSLSFRSLGADDFSISPVYQRKNRKDRYLERLAVGHRCFGFVTDENETASYLWLSSPLYGAPLAPFEGGLTCGIPEAAVYIWDCRTVEAFQSQGLYREGLQHLQGLCRQDGAEEPSSSAARPMPPRSRASLLPALNQDTS